MNIDEYICRRGNIKAKLAKHIAFLTLYQIDGDYPQVIKERQRDVELLSDEFDQVQDQIEVLLGCVLEEQQEHERDTFESSCYIAKIAIDKLLIGSKGMTGQTSRKLQKVEMKKTGKLMLEPETTHDTKESAAQDQDFNQDGDNEQTTTNDDSLDSDNENGYESAQELETSKNESDKNEQDTNDKEEGIKDTKIMKKKYNMNNLTNGKERVDEYEQKPHNELEQEYKQDEKSVRQNTNKTKMLTTTKLEPRDKLKIGDMGKRHDLRVEAKIDINEDLPGSLQLKLCLIEPQIKRWKLPPDKRRAR